MADASFQQEFLVAHNTYRSMHNTPPMTLSKELTASAQKWADHLLKRNALEHSDSQDGENVYFMSSTATIKLTGRETVDSWYSEVKNYNWSYPGFSSKTGHFTQVVWKDSTELGVGMATDGRRVFVVGQYRPAGNIMRHFENNVLPLGSTTAVPMSDTSFRQEFLESHNTYRSKHKVPPMSLSKELTASAQKWADHLLQINALGHSGSQDGENIYSMSSTATIKLTGEEAVDSWYSEIKNYNWSNPGFSSNTGHFTQVVWKDSTELGVGMATDGRRVIVVGQYRPAGNIMRHFENNVLHPASTVPMPTFTTTVTMADTSFQQKFLESHNTYRSKHRVPPMSLSKELTASAQKWADHLLQINVLKHSGSQDGENIYSMSSTTTIKLTGEEAVDSWYSEIKNYNWSNPGFSSNTGHFTQVVWKDSTQLGVGMATDGKRVIVVGQYRPAGNIMRHFENNVLHPASTVPRPTFTTTVTMADTNFQQEFLESHNTYRSKHRVPPMSLSKELTASAQKWADHLLQINVLKHSGSQDGENVYYMSSTTTIKLTGEEAVDSWYSEIKNYNWSNPGFSSNTGHFTQVVWKDSTELGVGMATDGKRVIVVGQYRPAGNIMRHFENNVLHPASTVPRPTFTTTVAMADTSFQQEFLESHNTYRSKHRVPPMSFSKELTASAQKWADHLLQINVLKHSDSQDGENVYYMSSTATIKPTGKEAVDSWYGEVKNYNWSYPGFSSNTGHFTQVVWKDSTQLGVGMATDGRRVIVVGQYRPAGNIMRHFEDNVFPPAGSEVGGAENTSSEGGDVNSRENCTLM